jgi:PST family polysaccharide transporter
MYVHSPKPSLWVSTAWLALDRFAILSGTLLTQVLIVRHAGLSLYGELSVLLAVVTLLGPVMHMGLAGTVTKSILSVPSDYEQILSSALTIRFVGITGAVIITIIYAFVEFDVPSDRLLLIVLMMGQYLVAFQVIEFFFQASERVHQLAPYRLVAILASTAIKCFFAIGATTLKPLVWAFFIEYVLIWLAYAMAYRKATGDFLVPKVAKSWFGWLISRSKWLVFSGFAEVLYLKIDILMIEHFRGAEETGVYSVAARLSELWYLIPTIIMAAWFPRLWSHRSSDTQWRSALQRSMDGLFLLALTIAIVMQFAAEPIVSLIFGEGVAAAAPILVVHIWAAVFIFMRAVVSRWLIAEDLPRYSLMTHVLGALTNVLLNWWWIPIYGGLGAAYATLVSYAVAGWLSLFVSARTRPMAVMMGRSLCLPLRWREWRAANV